MNRRTITHVPMHFRPRTGPLQFGTDWPGVFLRGDECGQYWQAIRLVCGAINQHVETGSWLESTVDDLPRALASLQELSRLLKSCRLGPEEVASMLERRRAAGGC